MISLDGDRTKVQLPTKYSNNSVTPCPMNQIMSRRRLKYNPSPSVSSECS
jgi:hypothetical protein